MTSELPPRRGAATRKGAGTTLGRLIQRRAAMLLKPAIEQAIRQIVAVLHDFHPADRKWLVKALVEDERFAPLLPDAPVTPLQTCAVGSVPEVLISRVGDHLMGRVNAPEGVIYRAAREVVDMVVNTMLSASPSPPVIESGGKLLEALIEATDGWQDCANYKGQYLAEKHGDFEGVAKMRALIAELHRESQTVGGESDAYASSVKTSLAIAQERDEGGE
jgi:hypothetical protein